MTIQTINIGTSPNDDNGDDPRTVGQKLNSNFTASAHAASRDVGTATGNIPDAEDLDMVGATENYTSNNLNPNVFGVQVPNDVVSVGYVQSPTIAIFPLPVTANPLSLTIDNTFNVVNAGFTSRGSGITPTLAGSSSAKLALTVATITGGMVGETVSLRADSSLSKITVNS